MFALNGPPKSFKNIQTQAGHNVEQMVRSRLSAENKQRALGPGEAMSKLIWFVHLWYVRGLELILNNRAVNGENEKWHRAE